MNLDVRRLHSLSREYEEKEAHSHQENFKARLAKSEAMLKRYLENDAGETTLSDQIIGQAMAVVDKEGKPQVSGTGKESGKNSGRANAEDLGPKKNAAATVTVQVAIGKSQPGSDVQLVNTCGVCCSAPPTEGYVSSGTVPDGAVYEKLFQHIENAEKDLKLKLECLKVNGDRSLHEVCPDIRDVLEKHVEDLKTLRQKPSSCVNPINQLSTRARSPSELRLENLLLKNCLALLCRDSPSKERDLNRRLRKIKESLEERDPDRVEQHSETARTSKVIGQKGQPSSGELPTGKSSRFQHRKSTKPGIEQCSPSPVVETTRKKPASNKGLPCDKEDKQPVDEKGSPTPTAKSTRWRLFADKGQIHEKPGSEQGSPSPSTKSKLRKLFGNKDQFHEKITRKSARIAGSPSPSSNIKKRRLIGDKSPLQEKGDRPSKAKQPSSPPPKSKQWKPSWDKGQISEQTNKQAKSKRDSPKSKSKSKPWKLFADKGLPRNKIVEKPSRGKYSPGGQAYSKQKTVPSGKSSQKLSKETKPDSRKSALSGLELKQDERAESPQQDAATCLDRKPRQPYGLSEISPGTEQKSIQPADGFKATPGSPAKSDYLSNVRKASLVGSEKPKQKVDSRQEILDPKRKSLKTFSIKTGKAKASKDVSRKSKFVASPRKVSKRSDMAKSPQSLLKKSRQPGVLIDKRPMDNIEKLEMRIDSSGLLPKISQKLPQQNDFNVVSPGYSEKAAKRSEPQKPFAGLSQAKPSRRSSSQAVSPGCIEIVRKQHRDSFSKQSPHRNEPRTPENIVRVSSGAPEPLRSSTGILESGPSTSGDAQLSISSDNVLGEVEKGMASRRISSGISTTPKYSNTSHKLSPERARKQQEVRRGSPQNLPNLKRPGGIVQKESSVRNDKPVGKADKPLENKPLREGKAAQRTSVAETPSPKMMRPLDNASAAKQRRPEEPLRERKDRGEKPSLEKCEPDKTYPAKGQLPAEKIHPIDNQTLQSDRTFDTLTSLDPALGGNTRHFDAILVAGRPRPPCLDPLRRGSSAMACSPSEAIKIRDVVGPLPNGSITTDVALANRSLTDAGANKVRGSGSNTDTEATFVALGKTEFDTEDYTTDIDAVQNCHSRPKTGDIQGLRIPYEDLCKKKLKPRTQTPEKKGILIPSRQTVSSSKGRQPAQKFQDNSHFGGLHVGSPSSNDYTRSVQKTADLQPIIKAPDGLVIPEREIPRLTKDKRSRNDKPAFWRRSKGSSKSKSQTLSKEAGKNLKYPNAEIHRKTTSLSGIPANLLRNKGLISPSKSRKPTKQNKNGLASADVHSLRHVTVGQSKSHSFESPPYDPTQNLPKTTGLQPMITAEKEILVSNPKQAKPSKTLERTSPSKILSKIPTPTSLSKSRKPTRRNKDEFGWGMSKHPSSEDQTRPRNEDRRTLDFAKPVSGQGPDLRMKNGQNQSAQLKTFKPPTVTSPRAKLGQNDPQALDRSSKSNALHDQMWLDKTFELDKPDQDQDKGLKTSFKEAETLNIGGHLVMRETEVKLSGPKKKVSELRAMMMCWSTFDHQNWKVWNDGASDTLSYKV